MAIRRHILKPVALVSSNSNLFSQRFYLQSGPVKSGAVVTGKLPWAWNFCGFLPLNAKIHCACSLKNNWGADGEMRLV
jgi:hypothetical protein